MPKLFNFSEDEWDEIRPPSVKDLGMRAAINGFLKLVPGGNISALKTSDDCVKAQEKLAALGVVLGKATDAVGKVKDDSGKKATKVLKDWTREVDDGEGELKERLIKVLDGIVEIPNKTVSKQFDKILKQVLDISDDLKKAGNNMGHSEKMRDEALMAMVVRAGELREKGNEGKEPGDFISDGEFKASYTFWNQQVEVCITATKVMEEQVAKQLEVKKEYKVMISTLKAAVAELGTDIDLDFKNVKEFKKLKADVDQFDRDLDTKYADFNYIPDFPKAGEVRREAETDLAIRFKKIQKIDAESYFQEELRKYGFNERQLKKAVSKVKTMRQQVAALSTKIQADRKLGGALGKVTPDIKKLSELRDELVEINDQYKRGRANQEVAQALSKDVNAGVAKEIKAAMDDFAAAAEEAIDAVKEASKDMIGGHRN